jgi:hypothetical protein
MVYAKKQTTERNGIASIDCIIASSSLGKSTKKIASLALPLS